MVGFTDGFYSQNIGGGAAIALVNKALKKLLGAAEGISNYKM